MEWKWLAMLLLPLLMLGTGWSEGCLEEERVALFRLKPSFPFINLGPHDDCCKQERVECNPLTGRVTHLFLNRDLYSFDSWYLNASLFLPFEELQFLSMSGNSIVGCVAGQGFERLSLKLNKLEILDLSYNNFNDSIFTSLSELSSLKSLNLAYNSFRFSNSTNDKVSSLKFLNLTYNSFRFSNPTNAGIEMLLKLSNLETLDLTNDLFNNSILSSLGRFSNLKSLSFGGYRFGGSIDIREINGLNNLEDLQIYCLPGFHCSLSLQSLNLFPLLKNLSLSRVNIHDTSMSSYSQNSSLKLKNLETLKISYGSIGNDFFQKIEAMPSLKILRLQSCGLNNTLKGQGFCGSTNLQKLDMSWNSLEGKLPECFSNFTYLESLDLSSNQFSGDISVLKTLTSLKSLDLSSNKFFGDISALETLTSLKRLDLSDNQFSGDISALKTLTSLASLSFYSNKFSGDISALETLTSVESLDLSTNQFSGDISSLRTLTSLASLSLYSNKFSGDISALETLTSVESLDLSSNQFAGDVLVFKSLISLKDLDISNNYFQIPSSLEPFFNLSELKHFKADNNIIYVENAMQSLIPKFQLYDISLSCCGDAGQFPQFLYHQRGLLDVELSHINLKGGFPTWLLQNNTNLQILYLANNSLEGHFELPFLPHALRYLDISNNSISGNVSTDIRAKLPSLVHLNMSNNHFHGSIPTSIGDMNSLELLDMSNNRLSGKISDSLSNCRSLSTLDLSNNDFSGEIPKSMGNMSSLSEIGMANNHLEGPFPMEFCHLHHLILLDLSMNNISGQIPSCFNPLSMIQVHLSRNKLEGTLTNVFWNSTSLVAIDLSKNHFTGKIPNWIGNLSQLSYLLLDNNHFEGSIPIQLCKLDQLSVINLSNNNLSGTIPPCLKITTLNEIAQGHVRYEAPSPSYVSTVAEALNLSDVSGVAEAPGSSNVSTVVQAPSPTYGAPAPEFLIAPSPSSVSTVASAPQFAIAEYPVSFSTDEPIEFPSKNMTYSYKGRGLTYLSGIDLSCNKLTGKIPNEVKNFQNIYALNLSHNSLTGSIPQKLSNLKQIESLDLSHNNLSGEIPPQLVGLYTLSYFSVAYNNFSGSTPVMIAQFSTFDESSYVGNPLLCGKPLPKNCPKSRPSRPLLPKASTDNGFIDMTAFYASFVASYAVVILSIGCVLYINPYWRRAWFYYTGKISKHCYYFLEDHILPKRFYCAN